MFVAKNIKNNRALVGFLLLFFVFFVSSDVQAQSFETSAKQAILFDAQTGQILYEKNADERMPTSSMSKVLTAIVIFDAIKDGRISLDTRFRISKNAWRKGGSKMFLREGSTVAVEDLLRGVIVQSGNDATIALAEGLAGTEEDFSVLLNLKAREIGMYESNFTNASGWPDDNHYSTARDLLKMGIYLVDNYPEFYKYYSETEFTFSNIKQENRNPLLSKSIGVDGIKTGHTENAGFGLIASSERNGRRLFMVVNGLGSMRLRETESERLINWGYNQFKNIRLFQAGETIDNVRVWMGKNKQIPLVVGSDVLMSVPVAQADKIQAKLVFKNPLPAPIQRGEKVGTLEIALMNDIRVTKNIFAGEDSPRMGFFGRTFEKAKHAVFGQ